MNKMIVKLEGLLVLISCIYVYATYDYSWTSFLLLFLLPDVSIAGYLWGNRAGARIYNLFHTYLTSAFIVALGLIIHNDVMIQMGIIWMAHIGIDRFLGYGLKYVFHFKDTHINRL
jgi:hypothetical protein